MCTGERLLGHRGVGRGDVRLLPALSGREPLGASARHQGEQVGVQRVHRRDRVGDGALEQTAALLDGLGVVHDVADVVQRVEDAEDLDAVAVRRVDKAMHDLLGVVLVADARGRGRLPL